MRQKSSLRLGLWFATVLSLVGAGCSPSSGPARTVSYFQAHAQEREAVFKRCADDPGTLGKTAECVNAGQAEAIEGIGSFRHLAPMQFPPGPGAKVKKRAGASDSNSAP
jgi:hypothetical protein